MHVANKLYLTAEEVAFELGVSKSYAYKIVRRLNKELVAKNIITVPGKVNARYFYERACYGGAINEERK